MPGGVSANGRIYFLPYPVSLRRAQSSKVVDVDDNEYIDYLMSFGALVLGHGHPRVKEANRAQLDISIAPGTLTEVEVELARKICTHVKAAEQVRFVNSGTEAVMYALRIARAYTKKEKIAKFEGGFHGSHDYALVSTFLDPSRVGKESGPNPIRLGTGVPKAVSDSMTILPYNNLDDSEALIEENKDELAAVIVEPLQGVGGAIPADKNFLSGLRKVTNDNDILLIFDEIITGYRLSLGGGQEMYGISPDLVTLGKIIGGGLPIGAYAGRKEIMEIAAPSKNFEDTLDRRVFQSGTFNGHPFAMVAGLATVNELEENPQIYSRINDMGETARRGLQDVFEDANIDANVVGAGSIFNIHFTRDHVRTPRDTMHSDMEKTIQFGLGVMNKGIFLPPLVHGMISAAHTE